MVSVAWLRTALVGVDEVALLRASLARDELARAERMSDPRAQICAQALVRMELSLAHPSVPPSAWTFARTDAGRPFVTAPATEGRVSFNLSHTDGLVAVAVGASDVGVDVEALARGEDILDTVLRAFARVEVAALRALPADEHEHRAVELWTVKEAYLKGLGTGISRHLDRFAVAPLGPGLWAVEEAPDWRVHTRLVGRWMLAVAADAKEAIAYRGEGVDQVR